MNATFDRLDTIVEYSDSKTAFNGYPERIVSPPVPGPCCATEMQAIGEVHMSPSGPYVYKLCTTCGHTVRHFLLSPPVPLD